MDGEIDMFPTRQSLLSRLKDCDDQESWRSFFDAYWRLIYNAALKSGLSDAEAQDVVQTTLISVMKSMPNFQYDATKSSFKSWLLIKTKWRISDHLRKRQREIEPGTRQTGKSDELATDETATIDRIPDPGGLALEAVWDEEWEQNLLAAAIDRVKKKIDPKQYQIFDLHALRGWTVLKVAATLRVNPGRVYLTKHRIYALIKKEISYLRQKMA
jgi:RNA polymerase sigma factor (sigma-70 family)